VCPGVQTDNEGTPIDRPQIDPETHERLKAWARWARGKYLPSCLQVKCLSLECGYLPPSGDVWLTAEEAIKASLGPQQRQTTGDEWETERAVVGLPDKPRTALKLHYIIYKQMPMVQKRRILACTEDEYWLILLKAGQMLRNRLQLLDKAKERTRISGAIIRPL
jgi:hypothetical protein